MPLRAQSIAAASYCAQMAAKRIAVIGARWPDISIECAVLGRTPDEVARDPGTTRAGIVTAGTGADVILAGPRPQFDADTLEQLRCRGIVRYGVGYDNVDIAAANRLGIVVAVVPDYDTDAVALHTIALVLSGLRRIGTADQQVKSGDWDVRAFAPLHVPAVLTAGVVGFGRIGRRTAAHLHALGFERVIGHDPFAPIGDAIVHNGSLEDVLAESDVVSLHAPGRPDGTPLIRARELDLMKPGSILVNTARGSLIDTDALVSALGRGRPALAALDVFDPEPPDPGRFTPVLDRVIMTPHMAWYSEESEHDLRVKAATEAKRILDGLAPMHPVSG